MRLRNSGALTLAFSSVKTTQDNDATIGWLSFVRNTISSNGILYGSLQVKMLRLQKAEESQALGTWGCKVALNQNEGFPQLSMVNFWFPKKINYALQKKVRLQHTTNHQKRSISEVFLFNHYVGSTLTDWVESIPRGEMEKTQTALGLVGTRKMGAVA